MSAENLPSDLVLLSFLTTSMPHDAHTSNASGEMMSGLCGSWLWNLSATSCQSVASQLQISQRLVAEDFTANVSIKSVCNR